MRKFISFTLISLFAVVVANGTTAVAGSAALGALFRLILVPFVMLTGSLIIVQNWGREQLSISFSSFPQQKTTAVLVFLSAILTGILICLYAHALNLISVFVLLIIIGCSVASYYFISVNKDHLGLALLIFLVPWVEFFEWDSGASGSLLVFKIGHLTVIVKTIYIIVGAFFSVWTAKKLLQHQFPFSGFKRYTPLALLVLYVLLSSIFFTSPENHHNALNRILSMIVFPILIYVLVFEIVDTKEKMFWVAYASIAMVVIHTFINFYMSYRTMGIGFTPSEMFQNAGMVRYGMGSPTVKSVEVALITPLLLGLWILNKGKRFNSILLGLIVFVVVAQLMSFSRGGFLAALAGAACLVKKHRIKMLAAGAVIIVGSFWETFYNQFLIRFHKIFVYGLSHISLKDLSYGRYEGWKAAIGMWFDHPFLGVGFSNFGNFSHFYSGTYPTKDKYGDWILVYMTDAHNFFLEILSELGVVGFGIILVFLLLLFTDIRKGLASVKRTELEPIGWALLGVLMVTAVLSMTADGFWVAKVTLGHNILYWTLFALIGRLCWIKTNA